MESIRRERVHAGRLQAASLHGRSPPAASDRAPDALGEPVEARPQPPRRGVVLNRPLIGVRIEPVCLDLTQVRAHLHARQRQRTRHERSGDRYENQADKE